MRKMAGLGAAMMVGVAAAGCQPKPQQGMQQSGRGVSPSALDVKPVASAGPRYAAPTRGPAVVPPDEPTVPLVAAPPAIVSAPPAAEAKAVPASAHISASNKNYTVRKGDTLFRIARSQYGDGKQWTRLASANPGLTAQTLKAGQMIVVP